MNRNMTVIIDIIPAIKDSPKALDEIIPVFNGYSTGYFYRGYDASGTAITDKLSDKLHPYWRYEHRFSNCFTGVTYEEFENYYKALGDSGFSGVINASNVDGCDVISVDITKVVDDETYGVFVIFNQTTRTLDIAYTNHAEYYINQQQ